MGHLRTTWSVEVNKTDMSDTDLDVSSLASADDGVLVFPEDDGEDEEEEEEDYETEEEEELLFEEDSEERSGVRTSSPPFLLVPEEDLELGRSSIGNVQL